MEAEPDERAPEEHALLLARREVVELDASAVAARKPDERALVLRLDRGEAEIGEERGDGVAVRREHVGHVGAQGYALGFEGLSEASGAGERKREELTAEPAVLVGITGKTEAAERGIGG